MRNLVLILVLAFAACERGKPTGSAGNGNDLDNAPDSQVTGGAPGGTGGNSGISTIGPNGELTIIIRDFRLYSAEDPTTNPDFENVPKTDPNGAEDATYQGPWNDPHIVADTLGADGKPVYKNPGGTTLTTHGQASFDQWFRDVPGTNIQVKYPLFFELDPFGYYIYDSLRSGTLKSGENSTRMFFPIDDGTPYATAFGNQGQPHNYSFTVELHTSFVYQGGEFLSFRGDDDVFVFINKKLVINLGGIHGEESADVKVDTLGLTKGKEYPFDFFYAERHADGSNLFLTTSLGLKPE